MSKTKDLHIQAIELMEKLIKKYNLKDELLSLDDFLYEYTYIITEEEIDECIELIDKF